VLKPPPLATRRCPRCRQRIIVKRVGDRRVYLAEAAVPVFDAERRRLSNAGRWTGLRDRWLELALKAGADERRAARIARDPVSELVVEAARSLYMTAAERSFRAARHDRRWDDAARIRFEQALAVHRVGGSPVPVSIEVVRLHREGVVTSLRGIGGVAPEAELRAGRCCDECRADDGVVVRVDDELRAPRLPHAGCPKGPCACRWYVPPRYQDAVRAFLRRQLVGARRTGPS
jgi:hypothetical protein